MLRKIHTGDGRGGAGSGTRVDLICGSNSQLRALAEVYGCEDSQEKFQHDFVAVWLTVLTSPDQSINVFEGF